MAGGHNPSERHRHSTLAWALWIGSLILVGVLLYFPLVSNPLPASSGYVALFFANLLGSLPLVLTGPGQLATFVAGSTYNPFYAGLVAGSGALIGDSIGYILGRLGRLALPQSTPRQARVFINRIHVSGSRARSFPVLFFLALLPNPFFDFVALGCGIGRIGVVRYFLPTALGKLLRFLAWSYIGSSFSVNVGSLEAVAPMFMVPGTAAMLSVISWWFLSTATGERQGFLMHFSLFAAVAHLELITHGSIQTHPLLYPFVLAALIAGLAIQVWIFKHQRELTHQRYVEVLRIRAHDGHHDAVEHWASVGLNLTGADFYPSFYRSVWPDHHRDEQKRRFIEILPAGRFKKEDLVPNELDVPAAIRHRSWLQHLGLCVVMWLLHVAYIIYSVANAHGAS